METNFRLYLQSELLERCRKNPAYSLRAFARSLGCDYSTLAKIISGKRAVGRITVEKLGAKLGLGPDQIHSFLPNKKKSDHVGADYQQLSVDSFKLISDWQHYAILELMRVDGFVAKPQWIAKKLGLTLNEVNAAVERLQRVGILEIGEGGRWIDHSDGRSTTIGNRFTTAAFRNLQKQVLTMALQALEDVPFEKRDQSSMTMAIDTKKIPEAKERIKEFRRDMAAFLSRGERRDEVYQMSISLFPIIGAKK